MNILKKIEGDRINLVLTSLKEAVPDKKYVEVCNYNIILKDTSEVIGICSAKLGMNEVIFYIGNIGYEIYDNYRGNGYAPEAVKLLLSLFKINNFEKIYITNLPENNSSRRVCEKLNAKFLGTFEIPEDNIRRKEFNDKYMNIFELTI